MGDEALKRLGARNGRRISRLLREVVEACSASGLKEPRLFFEPESGSFFVMDGAHPHYARADTANMAERQEAVVARIPIARGLGCFFDAGAW